MAALKAPTGRAMFVNCATSSSDDIWARATVGDRGGFASARSADHPARFGVTELPDDHGQPLSEARESPSATILGSRSADYRATSRHASFIGMERRAHASEGARTRRQARRRRIESYPMADKVLGCGHSESFAGETRCDLLVRASSQGSELVRSFSLMLRREGTRSGLKLRSRR